MTQYQNSYYLQRSPDSEDEVLMKNELIKGHNNLVWSSFTVLTGSTVEINGDLYIANSDNIAFLSAPATGNYIYWDAVDWWSDSDPPIWNGIKVGYYLSDVRCVAQWDGTTMIPVKTYLGAQL